MIATEDRDSNQQNPAAPASGNEEIQSSGKRRSFSLVRITLTVIAAMAIITPLIIYLDSSGHLSSTNSAGGGSGMKISPPFDLTNSTIPTAEIRLGGPAKDGIPALTQPKWVAASTTTYLDPEDRVIGVSFDGQSRAYPLKILNYHEIVNDRLGDQTVVVTYCPLCDSAAVFDRRTELGPREFGVSGLLYNSNVLMYDRAKDVESLWSQVKAEGISGPGANRRLKSVPMELTTWEDWNTRHPDTTVLSQKTGHHRLYTRNPYATYFEGPQLMFPAEPRNDRLPDKERVLGVWSGEHWRAYPESAFNASHNRVQDTLNGKLLTIEFNPNSSSLRVAKAEEGIEWMYSLWFAWYAMHPETNVYPGETN